MLGGNVAYTRNLADANAVCGRIAAAGTVTAPLLTPHFTVAHTGSTGVYAITFSEPFVVFAGCQVTLEGATTVPTTALNVSYNWAASTRVLTVVISSDGTTPAGTDAGFAFYAQFAEISVQC